MVQKKIQKKTMSQRIVVLGGLVPKDRHCPTPNYNCLCSYQSSLAWPHLSITVMNYDRNGVLTYPQTFTIVTASHMTAQFLVAQLFSHHIHIRFRYWASSVVAISYKLCDFFPISKGKLINHYSAPYIVMDDYCYCFTRWRMGSAFLGAGASRGRYSNRVGI